MIRASVSRLSVLVVLAVCTISLVATGHALAGDAGIGPAGSDVNSRYDEMGYESASTGARSATIASRVGFGVSQYTEARGDIVNISVVFGDTDTATVQIGTTARNNYYITATVVDDNDDGMAYIELNTFEAGVGGSSPDTVLRVSDDDRLQRVRQGGGFTEGHPGTAGTDILDAGSYELRITGGDANGTTISDPDGLAALSLTERVTEGITIWTAPESEFDTLVDPDTEPDDMTALIENGSATRTATVADGDLLIVAVKANGLEGTFTDTGSYQTIAAAEQLFGFSFETDVNANQETTAYSISDFSSERVTVLYDDSDSRGVDTHYIVIDSADLTEMVGDRGNERAYDAVFRVFAGPDDNDLATGYESVSETVTIVDRDGTIETNRNGSLVLAPTAGQVIRGHTNLAPGTEVAVELRSDKSAARFFRKPTAEVRANGTFVTTANLTGATGTDNFTAQLRRRSDDISDVYTGRVLSAQQPSEQQSATPTTEPVTDMPGRTETETQTPMTTVETDTSTVRPPTTTRTAQTKTTERDTAQPEATRTDSPEAFAPPRGGDLFGSDMFGITAVIVIGTLTTAGLLVARRKL